MTQPALRYDTEVRTVMFQGKEIRYTSRTPAFTPEQREKRRREIELALYDIVKKYQ